MKKYLLLMLVVLTGIVSSCKYDDDELWGSVDDLANRVSALETLTKQMNGDISALQAIVTAVQNQVAVSEVEKLTDGYILHFTNGTTATIKNGTDGKDGANGENGADGEDGKDGADGKDGKDAPAIGVAKDGDVYYWTITIDGETDWLTDDAGNKLPVTGEAGADGEEGKDAASGSTGAAGKDGITPLLKIDATTFEWMVSYDNGTTYKKVEGSANANPTHGTDGVALFEGVDPTDETVIITMKNGNVYVIPLLKSLMFYDAENNPVDIKNIKWNGETSFEFTYTLELDNAAYEVYDESGVSVAVSEESVTLTLSNSAVSDARAVVLFYNESQTLTAVFKFKVAPWDGKPSEELIELEDEGEGPMLGIATPADLKLLANMVNQPTQTYGGRAAEGVKTYKLLNDIDLNGHSWVPIGLNEASAFTGIFDGNGKTIKGLNVNEIPTGTTGAGLFGVIKDATLSDLTVTDAQVDLQGQQTVQNAALVVGQAIGEVTLENVVVEKEAVSEDSEADVQGAQNVGSIAGVISGSDVTIKGCEVKNANLDASSSTSVSSGEKVTVGGVVGLLEMTSDGTGKATLNIEGCKVGGVELSTSESTGGLSTSAGGVVGALKVESSVKLEQKIKDNSVSDIVTEEQPSTEPGNSTTTHTQGPVIGNMVELDPEISADIIKDNNVGEDVQIETQLTVQHLSEVLEEALKESGINTFEVKGSITTNTEVIIPAEGVDVTLNFDALATTSNSVLTIKQGTGVVATESTHQLTVNVPTTDAGQYLNIQAPETTVTLASGNYAKVTALTAQNTLVVGKDAFIENLEVIDGGVLVYGHVVNLLRAEGNTNKISLIIEEGGVVENIPSEGFDVEDKNQEGIVEEADGSFTISTVKAWKEFAAMINDGNTFAGKTVKLVADIDLNNELQEPIGVQEELDLDKICFAGTLDGQNYSIRNLKIDNSVGRFTGLFAFVQGATFKNLRLVGGEVKGTATTSSMYVGAFLGYGYGVTFINCHNEGCKVVYIYEKNSGNAGGITGALDRTNDDKYSYIIACTNSAEVSGAYCPSGITGGAWNGYVTLVACVNTGKISYSGTQLGDSNIYASGISGALGGSNNWMYGCFTDCEVEPGQGHSALVSDAGSSHVNFHYSYSANTSMSLLAAWGGPYTSDNETLGHSSYNDAVDNLNKGIQLYNNTATVPCTYKFVKGNKPTLVYAEPSTNSGNSNAGGNDFTIEGIY